MIVYVQVGQVISGSHWLIAPWEIQLYSQISDFPTHIKVRYLEDFLWNCHKTSPKISQYWFRLWLGVVRQQAITCNYDPRSMSPYDINRPQWVNGSTVLVQYICPSETCKFHLQVPIFKRVACRDLTIWQGDLHNSPSNGLYVMAAWNIPILSASVIFLVQCNSTIIMHKWCGLIAFFSYCTVDELHDGRYSSIQYQLNIFRENFWLQGILVGNYYRTTLS